VFVNVDRTQKVEEMDNLGTDEPPLASSMLETIFPIFSKEDESSDIIVISKYEMIEWQEQIGELLKVVEDHLFRNGIERELEEKVSALSQENAALKETLKKLEKYKKFENENVCIPIEQVQSYVADLLGPALHKNMTRERQKLPVKCSAAIPAPFHSAVFHHISEKPIEISEVDSIFANWKVKFFHRGSKAIITKMKVFWKNGKTTIHFTYEVRNGFNVLQWPYKDIEF